MRIQMHLYLGTHCVRNHCALDRISCEKEGEKKMPEPDYFICQKMYKALGENPFPEHY